MKLFGIGRCIYFIKFASHVMEIVRYMSYGLLFGIPVAVTFSEKIGCPATISGPSMRVYVLTLSVICCIPCLHQYKYIG